LPISKEGLRLLSNDKTIEHCIKKEGLRFYYKNIGDCQKFLGENTRAEESYDKITTVGASAFDYCRTVKYMFDLGKYDKIVNSFQKLVKKIPFSEEEKENIFPRMASILNDLATSYEKLGRTEDAVSFWKYYADISFYSPFSVPRESAKSCGIAGNKCLKMNKYPEARNCFLKSIRLNPMQAQNFSQLGYVNISLGRLQEGKLCLAKALSIRDSEDDRKLLEECQQKQKENIEVSHPTKNIDDLIDSAIVAELEGHPNTALRFYDDAITLINKQEASNNVEACKFVAEIWGLGKDEKSLELHRKIKDRSEDCQKIVIEAIIWFVSRKITKS
jgi:tetratricopeptide (TPR) repeat protein